MRIVKVKRLYLSRIKRSGRNNQGKICVWHRGGGNKRHYSKVDYSKPILNVPGIVLDIFKDSNRSSNLSLILYKNGVLSYNIAVEDLKEGMIIINGPLSNYNLGNCLPLRMFPIGTLVSHLELQFGKGAQFLRGAGAFGQVLAKYNLIGNKILVRLKSGEEYLFNCNNFAMVGIVSNMSWRFMKYRKAGHRRWLGFRPVVRGVAMNPIDHPHGGNTAGGRCSVSPFGKLTKGKKTRGKLNKKVIYKRRL